MSIKSDVTELQSLKLEIKNLNIRKKELKEKEKILEEKIKNYLKAKDQPGVKHQGTAIILEEKEAPQRMKEKEKDMASIEILKKYGIRDSEKVLKEILSSRKGEKILKESLKIKKYKNNNQ